MHALGGFLELKITQKTANGGYLWRLAVLGWEGSLRSGSQEAESEVSHKWFSIEGRVSGGTCEGQRGREDKQRCVKDAVVGPTQGPGAGVRSVPLISLANGCRVVCG